MEQRNAPRIIAKKLVPIYIIKENRTISIGRVYDVSELGISFYCDDTSLEAKDIVSVMFDLGNEQFVLDASHCYSVQNRLTTRFAISFTAPFLEKDLLFV